MGLGFWIANSNGVTKADSTLQDVLESARGINKLLEEKKEAAADETDGDGGTTTEE